VIDSSGRIVAQLGLGVEGVLDSSLPSAAAPTLYSRVGDVPAAVLVALGLALAVRRRKKSAH
jgi:apolipoprotein N-acyltransferase